MVALNVRDLRLIHEEQGGAGLATLIRESLAKKEFRPEDISIRDLAEAMLGAEYVRACNPNQPGGFVAIREDAVSTADFSHTMGQIVYSAMLEEYGNPALIGDRLVRKIPTQFRSEKIAGVAGLGDKASGIGEGEQYPTVKTNEKWVETPLTTKRGYIVPVTKEAIFFDRTGEIVNRARDVARWLAMNREKRIIEAAVGASVQYVRNGAAAVPVYNTATPYDNVTASNALVDWTDVEGAMLTLSALTDPDTSEPILSMPNQLLVPLAKYMTARQIVNATEVRKNDGASNTPVTVGSNPLNAFEVLSSPYVATYTTDSTTWFCGEFPRAFAYMENWPLTVVQAASNSEAEFTADIVARFKASEMGTVAVIEPRYVTKCTA